eukprot:CAMPEP_0119108428 /NCGR_PEP_ID=MMETSP1180-20130426/14362_1 /TAXON_ID=3052 ORGANISM="Chlamydomonas cf sp, Strain CCMP681" /NCGR_SAMPLE_ID=MMETSP1180 /ASSEMBLY_ACC=CAM_ASM_000741 /LENGTH=64 /DNA_ID=CAMNT_0007094039 /DNA_START=239 /DNA_END=436 /DNA_ORIENTATION=-
MTNPVLLNLSCQEVQQTCISTSPGALLSALHGLKRLMPGAALLIHSNSTSVVGLSHCVFIVFFS